MIAVCCSIQTLETNEISKKYHSVSSAYEIILQAVIKSYLTRRLPSRPIRGMHHIHRYNIDLKDLMHYHILQLEYVKTTFFYDNVVLIALKRS